jgi:hypothetical protein
MANHNLSTLLHTHNYKIEDILAIDIVTYNTITTFKCDKAVNNEIRRMVKAKKQKDQLNISMIKKLHMNNGIVFDIIQDKDDNTCSFFTTSSDSFFSTSSDSSSPSDEYCLPESDSVQHLFVIEYVMVELKKMLKESFNMSTGSHKLVKICDERKTHLFHASQYLKYCEIIYMPNEIISYILDLIYDRSLFYSY